MILRNLKSIMFITACSLSAAFVAASAPAGEGEKGGHKDIALSAAGGDPYTLATCPVSGMGISATAPVVKKFSEREVRFCCERCPVKFAAEKDKYFATIDEKMIADQMPWYPLETCVISGGELGSMGEPVNIIHGNRLVRFCCDACIPKFKADPAAYLAKIDEAAIAGQSAEYPLQTCVVANDELGPLGVDLVVASRLVRFCCEECVSEFKKSPAGYLAKIDAAWKAKHPEMFEAK